MQNMNKNCHIIEYQMEFCHGEAEKVKAALAEGAYTAMQ